MNNPHTIVLASSNKGKLAEFSQMFSTHFANDNITLLPQSEFNVPDADETGLSFIENAILKARHASKISGFAALADDSGLEVDALNGAPGIYSARFSGKPSDEHASKDEYNNRYLLEKLSNTPDEQRCARYQCVLAYVKHHEDPMPQIFHGQWEGRILNAPRGNGGFGYDPLFFVESEQCSASELTKEKKNALSHRAKAISDFIVNFRR